MAYENLTKSKSRTAASWGPSASTGGRKTNLLGLGVLSPLNRRPVDWSGRLAGAGIRLRGGATGGTGQRTPTGVGHHNPNPIQPRAAAAGVESSLDGLSAKMDAETRSCTATSTRESAFGEGRLTEEDYGELARIRESIAELARKMDAVLERAGAGVGAGVGAAP